MPLLNEQQPRFTHTYCDQCFFVAHIDVKGEKPHDLWLCRPEDPDQRTKFNVSLILRYSDEGPDYFSGPVDVYKEVVLRRLLLPDIEPAPYPALMEALRVLYRYGLVNR